MVIPAFDDIQILDLVGPHEVFSTANRFLADTFDELVRPVRRSLGPDPVPYKVEVRTVSAGPIRTSSGLVFQPDRHLGRPAAARASQIDTLLIPGGHGVVDAAPALVPWIAAVAPTCRRITSVCSGSMLLAAAGVLDGRKATSHWTVCELMADTFPAVNVDPDPIFVKDGNVWTSAGVTSGIDLALALVEEDHGVDLARAIARYLVMFVQRPGGQAQFSTQLSTAPAQREPLRDLQAWIVDHPAEDLSVARLAERVHMSARHFSRVFRDEVGQTPADYVEHIRVEAARRHLESTVDTIDAVARRCGFGTTETMQRAFRRVVGVTPSDYRRHFTRSTA